MSQYHHGIPLRDRVLFSAWGIEYHTALSHSFLGRCSKTVLVLELNFTVLWTRHQDGFLTPGLYKVALTKRKPTGHKFETRNTMLEQGIILLCTKHNYYHTISNKSIVIFISKSMVFRMKLESLLEYYNHAK